jgi:hypothetical protein
LSPARAEAFRGLIAGRATHQQSNKLGAPDHAVNAAPSPAHDGIPILRIVKSAGTRCVERSRVARTVIEQAGPPARHLGANSLQNLPVATDVAATRHCPKNLQKSMYASDCYRLWYWRASVRFRTQPTPSRVDPQGGASQA